MLNLYLEYMLKKYVMKVDSKEGRMIHLPRVPPGPGQAGANGQFYVTAVERQSGGLFFIHDWDRPPQRQVRLLTSLEI